MKFHHGTNSKLRSAIGTGAMGLEHIRNLKLLSGAKIVACADVNERMRSEARTLLPEAIIIEDYRELIGLSVRVGRDHM